MSSLNNKSMKLAAAAVTAFALSVSAIAADNTAVILKKKNNKNKNKVTLNSKKVVQADRMIEPSLEPTAVSATNKVAVSVSKAAPSAVTGKKAIPLSLSDYSIFSGPAVKTPTKTTTADDSNDAITGLSSRHMVSLMYKANNGISFGPTADFNIQHTQATAEEQKGVAWNDSYFKVAKSGLAKGTIGGNSVGLDSSVRYLAPTSKGSRDNKTYGSVRMDMNPNMSFGKTALSLTVYNFVRAHLLSQGSNAEGASLTQYQLYTGPMLNYDFNDKIGAFVLYEATIKYNTKGESSKQFASAKSLTDLEPGVNFNLNKHISLAPYLNWYTAQPVSTTSINMSATLAM